MIRCCVVILATLASTVAAAQTPDPAPVPAAQPHEPVLRLSATASAKATPDTLVADLTALANAPSAVAAQQKVNELMQKAKGATDAVPALHAAFQDYSVGFIDERPAHWTAQQTLEISGHDPQPVLDLVGRLQSQGLALGSLQWRVSDAVEGAARRQATTTALTDLRQDAAEAAKALGLAVDRVQSVDLNGVARPLAFAGARIAAAPMAMPVPPPNSTREDQDVTVTVSAEILLRPAP